MPTRVVIVELGAATVPASGPNGRWYRVYIVGFGDVDAARAEQAKLALSGLDAIGPVRLGAAI